MNALQLKTGDKAYYDGMRGCIECKVLKIVGPVPGPRVPSTAVRITVVFTETKGGWNVGDEFTAHAFRVFPLKALNPKTSTIRAYLVEVPNQA